MYRLDIPKVLATGVEWHSGERPNKFTGSICLGSSSYFWKHLKVDRTKAYRACSVYVFAPERVAKRYRFLWQKLMPNFVPLRLLKWIKFEPFTFDDYRKAYSLKDNEADSACKLGTFETYHHVPCYKFTITNLSAFSMADWLAICTLALYPQRGGSFIDYMYKLWMKSKKRANLDWLFMVSHIPYGDWGHTFFGGYDNKGWVVEQKTIQKLASNYSIRNNWTDTWKELVPMTLSTASHSLNNMAGKELMGMRQRLMDTKKMRDLKYAYDSAYNNCKDYSEYLRIKEEYMTALDKYYMNEKQLLEMTV